MTELQVSSLEITNFRTFRHLNIERLGRVNLIVGKNNVGKTSILESLWLFAHQGSLATVWEILERRGEGVRPKNDSENTFEEQINMLSNLFYGFPTNMNLEEQESPIFTLQTSENSDTEVTVDISWIPANKIITQIKTPMWRVKIGSENKYAHYALDARRGVRSATSIPSEYITSSGLDSNRVATLWDSTILTEAYRQVILGAQQIAPDIEDIALVARNGNSSTVRKPLVKIKNLSKPVQIGTLGDGVNRMFGLVLALVNVKDGFLLVDEIENGFHHSILSDVWRLIFQLSHRLNVQVFATTHSWECVEAFQQIAKEDTATDGQLISLRAKEDEPGVVVAVPYSEEELAVATKYGIEVR